MDNISGKVLLRVQLSDATLRQLKDRAATHGQFLGNYADMIFRYALQDRARSRTVAPLPSAESTIYVTLEIPGSTKSKLCDWGGKQQRSLAEFAGALIDTFLSTFARDPRDFAMIHHVSLLLDTKAIISDVELRAAIRRVGPLTGVSIPPAHLARWFYARLRPLVAQVESEGNLVEVTVQLLEFLGSDLPVAHGQKE